MTDTYNKTADFYRTNLRDHPIVPQCPGRLCWAITPSDTMDTTNGAGDEAPTYAKAIWVGQTGDLNLVAAGDKSNNGQGTPILFKAVPVGLFYAIETRRVMATNTTASHLVGIGDVMTPDPNASLAPKQS